MPVRTVFDALVIGGGPAGLAAASALARQMYTAVVFSSGVFRNARADRMHNFLGWDNRPPSKLRQKARYDLYQGYNTTTFHDNVLITNIQKLDNGHFRASDSNGQEWEGRRVVLAHGITDIPEKIPGYEECWGFGIFHCLFCHGYEERGAEHVGVLATGETSSAHVAIHLARMAKRLAKTVTIYTHGSEPLAAEINSILEKSVTGIRADGREISRMEKLSTGSEVALHLADGSQVVCGFVANKPKSRLNGDFASQLGIELTEQGKYKIGQLLPETSVQGVFAAGDCGTPMEAVSIAASMGATAGVGIAMQLLAEPF